MIYRFWDGRNFRSVDPIDIHLRLQSHPKYLASRDLKLIDAGDREATCTTAAAVCDTFLVEPYNAETGRGLTVGERLGLLADFYFWIELQKKSINPLQTAPSNTESVTSPTSRGPITPGTADSTSFATEPTCETPTTYDMPSTVP